MIPVPDDLRRRLESHGQVHVLASWDRLTDDQRRDLIAQLEAIDLEQVRQLHNQGARPYQLPPVEKIQPPPVARLADSREALHAGEEVLRRGEVAVLVVAGGQGSRLGFDHPKGMFPVGPVSNKSLFQVHAEKVLARRRRHRQTIPFLVMTSDSTHAETVEFFAAHQHFGLPPDEVSFFQQGTMPAVDLATGKLLMEGPGKLFTSPNGHGGTLTALADSGLLKKLRDRGIKHIFYFQVDNPLIKVADPAFLGHHVTRNAEVSSKIVPKLGPLDKLGNLVAVDQGCTMIEYSDLPRELAELTDAQGQLKIWAGSPAIHVFSVDFLERVTSGDQRIPFHVARKKVPHWNESGELVQPEKENALKFEMFIFDTLPLADRWTVVETSRAEEFEPLKNATGPDSPETVKRAISQLAVAWLEKAGVSVSGDLPLEISPLYALDAEELARKVDRNLRIDGPTYLE